MSTAESLERPGAEAMIRRVMDVINAARPMPLSSSVMISREEIIELLEGAVEVLPAETREARFLLRDRDEVLAAAGQEAEVIIDEARVQVAQMVTKTEVVRAAEQRARQIVEEADAQARRRRHEVDDYCDQRLAQFDAALQRIHQSVAAARDKLRPEPEAVEPEPDADEPAAASAFFDQDEV